MEVLPSCTSHELLLVVEAVSLDGGDLHLVLLDDLLQRSVQLLLLLLEELLLLQEPRGVGGEERRGEVVKERRGAQKQGNSKRGDNRKGIDGEQNETRAILFQRDRRTEREKKRR